MTDDVFAGGAFAVGDQAPGEREGAAEDGAPRGLGLIVPCRNEAEVVARKLANLARVDWPGTGAHRLIVVDDGSDDATAERTHEAFERHAQAFAARGVHTELVTNTGRPGKPGAIASGLRALEQGGATELVVLTDADVVLSDDALVRLQAAFAQPALALACGAQRFVASLADDGTLAGRGGAVLVDASAAFDRVTAWARRVESRRGRLFSVHGQLVAWRRSLGLTPSLGIAADDIDLMLQVREGALQDAALPWRVERVEGALFYEIKTVERARVEAQELRRARAYVQVVRAWDGRLPARGLQWWFYRRVPLAAPLLSWVAAALCAVVAYLALGWIGLLAGLISLALVSRTPQGRGWLRLMGRIRDATRQNDGDVKLERWEMARR